MNDKIITKLDTLLELLELDSLPYELSKQQQFPLRVPLAYAQRMSKGDAYDPLLLQVLPLADEDLSVPGYGADPVADQAHQVVPGLIHKYHGRVLLLASSVCDVHCRYCFRRAFPYPQLKPTDWGRVWQYIQEQPEIGEVILSGGDPLSLSPQRLLGFLQQIESMPQIHTLRVHTRQPIVQPERMPMEFFEACSKSRLNKVLVLHANHANEVNDSVRLCLKQLRDCDVQLLNQAVLLKGINDDWQTQAQLSRVLLSAGVLPYYLNCLDRVQSSAHFEVSESDALALMQSMREHLPGYLVPRFVQDVVGTSAKQVLA